MMIKNKDKLFHNIIENISMKRNDEAPHKLNG
jgi:hypothetical protein